MTYRQCPGCLRKKRSSPNMIEVSRSSCQQCNYERVKKSTLRRTVKDAIATKDWSILRATTRNGFEKIPYDIIHPFVEEALAMAASRLVAMDSMGLSLEEQYPIKREAQDYLILARSLQYRRDLTELEKAKLWEQIQDRETTSTTDLPSVHMQAIDRAEVNTAVMSFSAMQELGDRSEPDATY